MGLFFVGGGFACGWCLRLVILLVDEIVVGWLVRLRVGNFGRLLGFGLNWFVFCGCDLRWLGFWFSVKLLGFLCGYIWCGVGII